MNASDRIAEAGSAAGTGVPATDREPPQGADPSVNASRSAAWTLFGTVLGLGLLFAATRQVNLHALQAALDTLSWAWSVVVVGVTLAFCAIKAWRWRQLLGASRHVGFGELHKAVYVGLAVNFLVAHVGEVLRAASVARRHGLPIGSVFASVVIERVLDFIAILSLLAAVLSAASDVPRTVSVAAAASAAFVAAAVAVLVLSLRPPASLTRLATGLSRRLQPKTRERLSVQFARFTAGLNPLTQPRVMALALIASVLQWALVVAAIWACGLAVTDAVSPMAAIVTFVLIVLGLTLPNAPLQIGTTQLAFVLGLGVDGTAASEAIAASLVYGVCLILPIMLAGGLLMLRGQLGRRQSLDAGRSAG